MKEFKRILSYARPYGRHVVFAFCCLALTSVISLILPLLVRNMINAVFVRRDLAVLNGLTMDLVLVILLQAVFAVAQNYIMGFVGQRAVTDFGCELFAHLQTLSLRFFHEWRAGDILSRLSADISVIQEALTSIPVAILRQTITLFGGIAIILYLNWKLTGLIIAALLPLMLFARVFGRRLRFLSESVQTGLGQALAVVEEVISSIKIVKAYTREDYEKARFEKEIEKAFGAAIGKVRLSAFFGPFILCLTFLVSALLVWYGGRQVVQGATSPGELAAFFLYGIIMAGPIGTFARLYTQVQEALGAARRIYEILDIPAEIKGATDALRPAPGAGRIQIENVSFAYEPGQAVLRDVSFELVPGAITALVGPSGAGKSTLIHLLCRFFDPDCGVIRLDGHDIRRLEPAWYLSQIAYVPQETLLFGGSIRENIRYGRLEAGEAEIAEAAKLANAHDFIMRLENGYDTAVGEKGMKLSGGERQRIAIARAILRNPRILILDEATSCLDNEAEAQVREALDQLMRHRTTLVIAHRLSTVREAARLAVLDRGRVAEVGNHQELLNAGGLYARLYALGMIESATPHILDG